MSLPFGATCWSGICDSSILPGHIHLLLCLCSDLLQTKYPKKKQCKTDFGSFLPGASFLLTCGDQVLIRLRQVHARIRGGGGLGWARGPDPPPLTITSAIFFHRNKH